MSKPKRTKRWQDAARAVAETSTPADACPARYYRFDEGGGDYYDERGTLDADTGFMRLDAVDVLAQAAFGIGKSIGIGYAANTVKEAIDTMGQTPETRASLKAIVRWLEDLSDTHEDRAIATESATTAAGAEDASS